MATSRITSRDLLSTRFLSRMLEGNKRLHLHPTWLDTCLRSTHRACPCSLPLAVAAAPPFSSVVTSRIAASVARSVWIRYSYFEIVWMPLMNPSNRRPVRSPPKLLSRFDCPHPSECLLRLCAIMRQGVKGVAFLASGIRPRYGQLLWRMERSECSSRKLA